MPVHQETLFIITPFLSGTISLILAAVAFRRRTVTGAWPFMCMLLGAALWSLGHGFEVLSPTLEAKIIWDNIQFPAESVMVLSSLIFAIHYTNHRGLLKRWVRWLLAIEPVLITVLAWTDPIHHLVRQSPRLVESTPTPALVYEFGVGMWIDAAYLIGIALIVLGLLFTYFSRAPRPLQLQIGVVLIGVLFPFMGGLIAIMGIFPPTHRDIFPEIFGISNLILAWGLFRQQLLDMVPIARAAIFDQMVDPVFVLDMQMRIVDLNPVARRLIGPQEKKPTGRLITEQFPNWPRPDKEKPLDSISINLETRQGPRYFDLLHTPLSDQQGKRTGCLVILRDITERRQAEEAYRVLVDHSLQGLTIFQNNRMVFANPTIADILGYSVDEITSFIAEEMFQVIHPEERGEAMIHMQQRLSGESAPERFEFRAFRKDGSIRWLETYSTVIDYHGQTAIQSAYLDITERKIAEEALREGENRYRSLVELMPIGVSILKDGHYIYFNPAGVEMFGYDRMEEMVGLTPFDIVANESIEVVKERIERLASGQSNQTTELQVMKKDGTIIFLETRSVPIRLHGESAYFIFGQDVTERRRSEEEREQLIEELDAFAHTVAHNIKGPLSIVMGFADVLTDNEYPSTEEQIKEGLDNIRTYTAKLSNIVDELLLLSSLREDQEIPATDLDMIIPIYGVRQRLANLIRTYEAQIDIPKSWPLAHGYGPWIEEVWVNYVSNAIKYGGRPPHLELGATVQPDGMIRFWVKDNGPGISPEDRAKLFIRHSRLDGSSVKGDGLGLSIVERIITRLGGEVGVESEPGKGSTFSFTLPPAEPPKP